MPDFTGRLWMKEGSTGKPARACRESCPDVAGAKELDDDNLGFEVNAKLFKYG